MEHANLASTGRVTTTCRFITSGREGKLIGRVSSFAIELVVNSSVYWEVFPFMKGPGLGWYRRIVCFFS